MSSRIRFSTARSVFEAFGDLRRIGAPPTDDSAPLDYVGALLASPRPINAIVYLAHLLPRREAVWWARQCVSAIQGERADDEAFRIAGAWVQTPDEERRRAAMAIGDAADQRFATTWLALAVGWSGGSIIAAEHTPVLPPPSACAKAANAAIVLAIVQGDPRSIGPWTQACVEAGVRFAEGGEARVVAPKPAPRDAPLARSRE